MFTTVFLFAGFFFEERYTSQTWTINRHNSSGEVVQGYIVKDYKVDQKTPTIIGMRQSRHESILYAPHGYEIIPMKREKIITIKNWSARGQK